jgi:hypothetical protein
VKSPARRRHHKAEKLSDAAIRIIEDGLAAQVAYEAIAGRVLDETGEKISDAAIGRYYRAKFAPRRDAQRSAALMAREMMQWMEGSTPAEVQSAIETKTAQQLFPMLQALGSEKPEHLAYFYASMTQRRIDEQKLAQRQELLEQRAKQLELMREAQEVKLGEIRRRLEAASAPKDAKTKTKAELLQTIRDLYGIARETAAPAQAAK